MAIREVDAISDAIIETEREIAGEAWGQEDTERADASGERSLEEMGDGLEGQHEADDEFDADGEETDGDEESDADGEGDGEAETAGATGKGKDGEALPEPKPDARTEPEGRVPSGKLREANERARVLQAELDTFKTKTEKQSSEFQTLSEKLDQAMRRIDDLSRAPAATVKPADEPQPAKIPDIFEDPQGFVNHLTQGFQNELSKRDTQLANQRVETSMAIAHAFHKDTFEKAFAAVNQLDPRNPDDRVTVQRIYAAPNPGEALVNWHKRSETLARVGSDPTAYEERIREETRQTLMKDPEFRKQLVADMRRDAAQGDNGAPRTTTRLPPSMHRVPGSNVSTERGNSNAYDGSDQSVAASAWD